MTGNPGLIEQYRQVHAASIYGTTSVKNLRFLRPEIKLLKPRSILDYGCGQSRLIDMLDVGYPVELYRYDPAIPTYANKPDKVVDLLISIDVLEHIEEADLDEVLTEMRASCRNAVIVIDTKPAKAILPDGRNAHVTVRPHAWWREKLLAHFSRLEPVATVRRSRAGFKTWSRTPYQSAGYLVLRLGEEARYHTRRLSGRHTQF